MPAPSPQQSTSPSRPEPPCTGTLLTIDLPTALRLANAGNPTIALARERVQEAYYRLREAEAVWLPTLQTGPTYTRHDGRIQNSLGLIFPTSKNSFFEGGGAVLSVSTSDILYGPLIARRLVDAQAEASRAVTDDVQLDVALTYLDLLRVYGALAINAETLRLAGEMTRVAREAKRVEKSKTGADLNRALTELNVRREERLELEGQAAAVSARLAQLLLLDPTVDLQPFDPAVVPITLVPENHLSLNELVAVGLRNRPELAESRDLVEAALARWRQAQWSPLLPRLQASYIAGTFGGGINDAMGNFGSRGDGLAQVIWELQGLGCGYVAHARVTRAQYNEANIHVTEVAAQVAAEVVEAAKVSLTRRRALASAQAAVRQAEEMWRKLREIAFGIGGRLGHFDPLEPLTAEQALAQARQLYLTQVIEYNKAQFRLYRAMGQPPLDALPQATALPVRVPVAPRGLPTREAPAVGGAPCSG
jgi:outer membrane protein TolC